MNTASTFLRTPEVNRKWEYGEGHEFADPEEQTQKDYERNMEAAKPLWKKYGYRDQEVIHIPNEILVNKTDLCDECGANPCYSHCKRYE